MLDQAISTLIGDIYSGARDQASWDNVLDRIKKITRSRFLFFSIVDADAQDYVHARFHGLDSGRFLDAIDEYRTTFVARDPTLRYALAHPHAGMVTLRKATAGHYGEDDYVRWYRSTLKTDDYLACYGPVVDGVAVGLSMHRRLDEGGPDSDRTRLSRMLFDHVDRAVRLAARPLDMNLGSEARLLLDARGRVIAVSDAARQMIARNDGLAIRDGRFLAASRAGTDRLDAMIRSALALEETGEIGGTVLIERPSGQMPWTATIASLPRTAGPSGLLGASVEIRLIEAQGASAQSDPETRWRTALGFTRAEARLAEALFAGQGTLRDAADRCGVTYGTARVQLAKIFEKANVHSQAQLARLLAKMAMLASLFLESLSVAGGAFA